MKYYLLLYLMMVSLEARPLDHPEHISIGELHLGMDRKEVTDALKAPCPRTLSAGKFDRDACTADHSFFFLGIPVKNLEKVRPDEIWISFRSEDYDAVEAAVTKTYPEAQCENSDLMGEVGASIKQTLCVVTVGNESLLLGRHIRADHTTGMMILQTTNRPANAKRKLAAQHGGQ